MQILITTATAAGTQPIYLPYDKAPVPFGDPLAATLTAATPSIISVPGYTPSLNDAVSFTVEGFANPAQTTQNAGAGVIALSTTYYVSGISATNTFTVSTSKGASVSSLASWSTLGNTLATQAGQPIVHLLSNQIDGTVLPFKPGYSVVAENYGAVSGTGLSSLPITLFGAADKTTVYGNPIGPGTWNVIATIGGSAPIICSLAYDWIVASGSTSTLVLIQN
jgi:hypothetical protein